MYEVSVCKSNSKLLSRSHIRYRDRQAGISSHGIRGLLRRADVQYSAGTRADLQHRRRGRSRTTHEDQNRRYGTRLPGLPTMLISGYHNLLEHYRRCGPPILRLPPVLDLLCLYINAISQRAARYTSTRHRSQARFGRLISASLLVARIFLRACKSRERK